MKEEKEEETSSPLAATTTTTTTPATTTASATASATVTNSNRGGNRKEEENEIVVLGMNKEAASDNKEEEETEDGIVVLPHSSSATLEPEKQFVAHPKVANRKRQPPGRKDAESTGDKPGGNETPQEFPLQMAHQEYDATKNETGGTRDSSYSSTLVREKRYIAYPKVTTGRRTVTSNREQQTETNPSDCRGTNEASAGLDRHDSSDIVAANKNNNNKNKNKKEVVANSATMQREKQFISYPRASTSAGCGHGGSELMPALRGLGKNDAIPKVFGSSGHDDDTNGATDIKAATNSDNKKGGQKQVVVHSAILQREKQFMSYPRDSTAAAVSGKNDQHEINSSLHGSASHHPPRMSHCDDAGAVGNSDVPVLRGIGKNAPRINSQYNNNTGILEAAQEGALSTNTSVRVLAGLANSQGSLVEDDLENQESRPETGNTEVNTEEELAEAQPAGVYDTEQQVTRDDGPCLSTQDDGGGEHPPVAPTNTMSSGDTSNSNEGLVEAMPVDDDQHVSVDIREAQPIDQEDLDQQEVKAAKEKQCRRFGCGIVAVACLVLTVSLVFGLKKESNIAANDQEATPSPTEPLPPMDNLDTLYDELPEKTKESLYNTDSPQYVAWEWLLNHPNITNLEEWRKKQIFAMAAFIVSFGFPSWPEQIRNRWMDANISECSWGLNAAEIAFFAQKVESDGLFEGTDWMKDYKTCDEDGKLASLVLYLLSLPTDAEPSIPPEIGLLTSLRVLGVVYSRISAKLSHLSVPEIIHLPSLEHLSFQSSGVSGTIPKDFGLMTTLRHLVLGANKLTGTIPSELGKMTSLEHFILDIVEGIHGNVPSELGLMTRLTALDIYRSSVTDSIPTELGLLTNMRFLRVDGNEMFGSVPSELGLMTGIKELRLGNDLEVQSSQGYNNYSGSLPNEIWELSHLEELQLQNLPHLSGSIPTDIFMPNLTWLDFSGSPRILGTIPDLICSIQELDFDCSELLCGCECECAGSSANHYY